MNDRFKSIFGENHRCDFDKHFTAPVGVWEFRRLDVGGRQWFVSRCADDLYPATDVPETNPSGGRGGGGERGRHTEGGRAWEQTTWKIYRLTMYPAEFSSWWWSKRSPCYISDYNIRGLAKIFRQEGWRSLANYRPFRRPPQMRMQRYTTARGIT